MCYQDFSVLKAIIKCARLYIMFVFCQESYIMSALTNGLIYPVKLIMDRSVPGGHEVKANFIQHRLCLPGTFIITQTTILPPGSS